MELYIETLTGTAFELRVSPFETIMSVKAKIQRLEGIPISQQHLIWQSIELEDDFCLHDYSIHDGATLKLVLQMRGGPINTRRVPMEDPALREMAEYMEANRDEILDRLPSTNKQVTLLVFRDGDQLNFFRVVDRGDGTLTPLSESWSPSNASMYNLYDDDDDEDHLNREKIEENDKMKEKVSSLRHKMEQMCVSKKPTNRRLTSTAEGPSSYSDGSNYTELSHGPMMLNKNTRLPPVGHSFTPKTPSPKFEPEAEETLTTEQQINALKEEYNKLKQEALESSEEDSEKRTIPIKSGKKKLDRLNFGGKSILTPLKEDSGLPSDIIRKSSDKLDDDVLKIIPPAQPMRKDTSVTDLSAARHKEVTLEGLKESLRKPPSSRKREIKGHSAQKDSFESITKDNYNRQSSSSSQRYDSGKDFTIESLTPIEARAMSGLLRQASIEKLGSSTLSNFVSSASKTRLPGFGRNTPEGRLMSSRHRMSASREGRLKSPGHRLPPVKSKKKAHKRCVVCAKKTGLATSYPCRCGSNFCAAHRYAEMHDCTFDYKTEGRKLLEASNPVVNAPKLPKI